MIRSEIGKRARELYDTSIRPKVEPGNVGRYIVIDANSGDYEVGDDYIVLTDTMSARHADSALYTLRIGYPVVGRIGGRARPVGA